MIPFEEALQTVLRSAPRCGMRRMPLGKSLGYVLAEDIVSNIDLPPFDKSAMDGYALRSVDARKPPVRLRSIGTLPAGTFFPGSVGKNEAVRIMTGSPLPKGTDAVIPVEDVEAAASTGEILVPENVAAGSNVCVRGEDLRKGTRVLQKGTRVGPTGISVLAAIGTAQVKVYARPAVAVLTTGNELVQPGRKLTKGKIYDSNGYTLGALLEAMGITPRNLGRVGDEEKTLASTIEQGLQSDVLIISGGVSVGDYDMVPRLLEAGGVRRIFHKIAIKPGKPLFFGKKGRTLVFGLPGNPVAGFVGFSLLVKPALRRMEGEETYPAMQKGILKTEYRQKPIRRRHFIPATIAMEGGRITVVPAKHYHGSADVRSLASANGFFTVEKGVSRVRKNTPVDCLPFDFFPKY